MIKITTSEIAPKVDAPVDGRIMHADHRIEAILLTLAPGETMAEHPNPLDVLFIGISGTGILTHDRQRYAMAPGTSIFVNANELRGWENPSANPLKVMVIKLK